MGSGGHPAEAQDAGSASPVASHSGRLLVRMPQSLHAELAEAAERDQVSLNQFITLALAAAVGWRQPSRNGAGHADAEPSAPPLEPAPSPAHRSARVLSLALTVNAVLVAIAAVLAIALLIAAWS